MEPSVWELAQTIAGINFLRYIIPSGLAFLIVYVLFKKKWSYKKIQLKFPTNKDYIREIAYSMITIVIFTIVALTIFATPLKEYTQIYYNLAEHSWGYWGLSIVLMILLHDTYFYWMHRAIHHPKLYKKIHLVHHKSVNPSPWASYAFHPIEGFLEAAIIYPIAFLIPYHPTALMVFLIFMITYNVYGHLGYELYPKKWHSSLIGKWVNTSVAHNVHHKYFKGNYGLYFLFWDRLMGTYNEEKAQAIIEDLDSRKKESPHQTAIA